MWGPSAQSKDVLASRLLTWIGELAQWVKKLAATPDDLSSSPHEHSTRVSHETVAQFAEFQLSILD